MTSRHSYHHRRHRRTISFTPSTSAIPDDIMYDTPPSMPLPSYSGLRIRPSLPWCNADNPYYESGPSRTPLLPLVDHGKLHHDPNLHCHRPYPLSHPNPYTPSLTPCDIPSRIAALNRRAAIVSAQLAHLTAVVEPLETNKPEALSQTHLFDMHQEGEGLVRALGMFEKQAEEVLGMLAELLNQGGGREDCVDWDWEEGWSGWERGKMRGKVRDV